MTLSRCSATLLALTLSGTAFAQATDTTTRNRTVVYAEQTVIDFTGVDVNVPVTRPSLTAVQERQSARFNPMIKLRPDFNKEMRESVSDLR